MPRALMVGVPDKVPLVFDAVNVERLRAQVDLVPEPLSAEQLLADPGRLAGVDIVLGTWGLPRLEKSLLAQASQLTAVLYAAGSVRGFVSDELWRRGIRVSSAYAANAIPVAEWTVAQMVLGLKRAFALNRDLGAERDWAKNEEAAHRVRGMFRSTVGLVSYGMIARLVRRLLRSYDVDVLVYDPFLDTATAASEDVEPVALDELFERSDVVSLHAPWLPETEGLIGRPQLLRLKQQAVFINTARGAIVDEAALVEVLRERPDLQALVDVTHPEPPPADSPLWELPNLWLTPHIAGSMGGECARMGAYMVAELERLLAGKPLEWEVTQESLQRMA